MSSLTTTTINTINGNTNLSLVTGNTAGPSLVLGTSGIISIRANSTTNSVHLTTNSFSVNSGATFNGSLTANGSLAAGAITSNGVGSFTSNVSFSGSAVTFTANVTANIVTASTMSLANSSVAANGYTYLPNGLLLNWGRASVGTSGLTATFSRAFATGSTPFSITIGQTSQNAAWITGSNATTVSLDSEVSSQTIYYMAIGQA